MPLLFVLQRLLNPLLYEMTLEIVAKLPVAVAAAPSSLASSENVGEMILGTEKVAAADAWAWTSHRKQAAICFLLENRCKGETEMMR